MNLTPMLLVLETLPPGALLGIWAAACIAAVGLALLIGAQLTRNDDPFATLPPNGAREVGDISERSRARHADGGMTSWQPQHTAAAARRRGRHHTGDRRWSGNLVEETVAIDVTLEDLAERAGGAA